MTDGSLGIYPHKKVHIELEPNAQPKHARAYPIPTVRLETFKKELMHLVELGVLSVQGVSEWASPTFIIPKNDNRVRWVSDLRETLMTADVLCAYPNHNKPFEIYTDASDYQLGACIMQDGKPVAYYSKKLTEAQKNYSTIDKELLCVVATLKEFCSMLFRAEIHIYTDHQNILCVGDSSQQRLRWISYVDEYGPTLHYITLKEKTM